MPASALLQALILPLLMAVFATAICLSPVARQRCHRHGHNRSAGFHQTIRRLLVAFLRAWGRFGSGNFPFSGTVKAAAAAHRS